MSKFAKCMACAIIYTNKRTHGGENCCEDI